MRTSLRVIGVISNMHQMAPGIQNESNDGVVRLGCQTNAWRIPRGDFSAFLEVVRRIRSFGFDGFETSFLNVQERFSDLSQTRRQIEESGLRFIGVHIFLLEY